MAVEQTIVVPSEDPEKKGKEKKEADSGKGKKKKDGEETEELSEEDQLLQSELTMLATRLKEPDTSLHKPALESLRTLIRTSTSSMTSVPKPLKFLRPMYPDLQKLFDTWSDATEEMPLFGDILSVLAMTYSDTEPRGTLKYRLVSDQLRVQRTGKDNTTLDDPGSWGHEYVRHLAAELGDEFIAREDPEALPSTNGDSQTTSPVLLTGTLEDLYALASKCAAFLLTHNAEPDAVDLFSELEIIDRIPPLLDSENFSRVAAYMLRCSSYLPPPDDITFLHCAHKIYADRGRLPEALAVAIRLLDKELIKSDFHLAGNINMKRQLAFMLARTRIPVEWLELTPADEEDPHLTNCLSNTHLSEHFKNFGKELGVLDPKSLEDIYKSHLEHAPSTARGAGGSGGNVDSARANLAGTFVNAFVNAGFGNDKLMVEAEEGNSWIYKNKDHGMLSTTASLGLSLLWSPDLGLSQIDKYTYSSEEHIKAGALLAIGLLHTNMTSDVDAPVALLGDFISNKSKELKTSAIMGLGLAYVGSCREDLLGLLLPIITGEGEGDGIPDIELASFAALALGLIFVSSANGDIADTILQTLLERCEAHTSATSTSEKEAAGLDSKFSKFLILGLGLLYLGLQDASSVTLETLKVVEGQHSIGKNGQVVVEMCSFAGTGNVLKVQQMLALCGADALLSAEATEEGEKEPPKEEKKDVEGDIAMENADDAPAASGSGDAPSSSADASTEKDDKSKDEEKEKSKVDDSFQAYAVLGIALIAMGEEVGAEMGFRQFNHLMHYGTPLIRRTIPLALALSSPSTPSLPLIDILSKYSHDTDLNVALSAIFALGIIGAGTNNAKLLQTLRQLAVYYAKEGDCLFVVRVSMGLVSMGKGTLGLGVWWGNTGGSTGTSGIMSRGAVAGLLSVFAAMLDAKGFVLDKYHWMLYLIAPAIWPRFLITLDEDLNALSVTARVGQAVDTITQAGKPRTISGFQTHQTPVRLGTMDRAELATEEYIPYASVLEGFVILKKNPGWAESGTGMEL